MCEESIPDIKNIFDRVIVQMLTDSKNENDEHLHVLPRSLFDPAGKIARLDVEDSVILSIMYIK